MRPFLCALGMTAILAIPVAAAETLHFEDAALRAVQFVDANEGWAVGDEGAIWHSIDGGKNWERQPSGVRASLRAVQFLNPFTGWVVGREELPHGGSAGVVLVTRDGGLKWQRVSINTLPGLQCVRFFDDKFGIVAGDGNEQFPSGIFTTNDTGRTWKSLPGPRCPSWLAADFHHDAQQGALAGSWSRLATIHEGSLGAADVDTLGGRSLFGLQLLGKQAVAAGQGGLVLVSTGTAGVRWGFADLKLPTEVQACLDFQAVCSRGDHVWLAGRPGSVVLHSPDRGRTWEMFKTGQPLPLSGIYFVNEKQGWAVGELGTILTTIDGGKSWSVQQQGGQRAAVLCVTGGAGQFPLDSVALVGQQDGYLVAGLRVTAADPASARPERAMEPQRCVSAIRLAGGAAAESLWQFPVPDHARRASKTDLLAGWDRLHAGRAAEQLLRQLVLAIRIWQPEIVLTSYPCKAASGMAEDSSAIDELLAEGLQEAFKRAADPKAFPEQIEQLGLKPWSVQKLYGRCDQIDGCSVVQDVQQAEPRLHGSAREFAADAWRLLSDSPVMPMHASYRLLASRIEGAASHHDLFQGISLAKGGTARRTLAPLPEPNPEEEKAIRDRRNLQIIAETPIKGLTEPNLMLGQIGPMLKNVPAEQGAKAAFAIATQLASSGQWELAREVFFLMVDRYPAHPLSTDAYRWLIRHNASSEARRRHELGQFLMVTQSGVRQGPKDSGPISGGPEAVQTRQLSLISDLAEARHWYEGALAIEPRLEAFGPLYAMDPSMQFCLQAARRNLGKFDEARDWYKRFQTAHPTGPWHDAAAAEIWLNNRNSNPPRPVAICRQASKPPYLDGILDDDCWQGMKPLRFRNAVGQTLHEKEPGTMDDPAEQEYATEAWLAFDKDFLYIALRCRHPAEMHVPPVKVRQRDADLRDYDRVTVMLDLDRDYNTAFCLHIDQRGCLAEDCWGDKSWNPRWFVAIRSEPTSWQVEAAIPLVELTGDPLTVGRCWACNVVRTLPGRGVQAWSLPADVEPRPEGMGLLMFTGDPQKNPVGGQTPRPSSGN